MENLYLYLISRFVRHYRQCHHKIIVCCVLYVPRTIPMARHLQQSLRSHNSMLLMSQSDAFSHRNHNKITLKQSNQVQSTIMCNWAYMHSDLISHVFSGIVAGFRWHRRRRRRQYRNYFSSHSRHLFHSHAHTNEYAHLCMPETAPEITVIN